jgi:hypothetical protein
MPEQPLRLLIKWVIKTIRTSPIGEVFLYLYGDKIGLEWEA